MRALLQGNLYTSEEALKVGWIDGICSDSNELNTFCFNKMEELIKIDGIKSFSFNITLN